MELVSPIDWLKASEEQRAKLYEVAKAIKDKREIRDWNEFLKLTLPTPTHYSSSYGGLFSSGRISRKNALHFYSWIAANHWEIGNHLAPDLFPHSSQDAWEQFLGRYGIYGHLRAFDPRTLSLTRRDDDQPIEETLIHFGEPYCFLLHELGPGRLLIFESHEGGSWHSVALGDTERDLSASIDENRQIVPWSSEHDRPVRLREFKDAGLRSFVGIHGEERLVRQIESKLLPGHEIHSTSLNEIADLYESEATVGFTVHRLNIVFVSQKT